MADEKMLEDAAALLQSEDEKKLFWEAYGEVKSDLGEIEIELDDCQRLSEDDFVVRINARD